MRDYTPPSITDYGNLVEMTASTDFRGPEDGALKLELVIPHHS